MDKNKVRVLSFQSEEVLNILNRDGVYHADLDKCRERRDYSEDRAQLDGAVPIWVFMSPNNEFKSEDFNDGKLLERYRCEMSLDQSIGLTKFNLLELEIDKSRLKHGLTHNAYSYAKVISDIRSDELKAVYKVHHTAYFYYKTIELIDKFSENILFPNGHSPNKEILIDEDTYELYLEGDIDSIGFTYSEDRNKIIKVKVLEVEDLGDSKEFKVQSIGSEKIWITDILYKIKQSLII